MEKRYILRKVGKCQGCKFELRPRDQEPCLFCERNSHLIDNLVKDKFEKGELVIQMPEGAEDNTDVFEQNKDSMKKWGAELKRKKKRKGLT